MKRIDYRIILLWVLFGALVLIYPDEARSAPTVPTHAINEIHERTQPPRPPLLMPAEAKDSDLEPGFPAKAFYDGSLYSATQGIHTLVGNIDADRRLEIIATSLTIGPLNAWNSDGSRVKGFPVKTGAPAYPALGQLSNTTPGLELFAGLTKYDSEDLYAYAGDGHLLPGWPRRSGNYIASPPALADVDGDGLDEIFIEEQDHGFHAYKADGTVLPGWPRSTDAGQELHTPAIGDLDGDGIPEIVTAGSAISGAITGVYLYVFHRDGTTLSRFPVVLPDDKMVDTFPVIGDVDGDGKREIIVVTKESATPDRIYVRVIASNGKTKQKLRVSGSITYGTQAALADLDKDRVPENIVQSASHINAWHGNGTKMPGFPINYGNDYLLGNSAPVVGDLDGDRKPDIAFTAEHIGSMMGSVFVYSAAGVLHSHFPKELELGNGAVPAIADIDLDGRNELIVTASGLERSAWGKLNKVWAYDLGGGPHGKIEWGQFGRNAQHRGLYGKDKPVSAPTP